MKRLNLMGQTFGRLTVIDTAPKRNDKVMWLCRCECGKEVFAATSDLRSGNTKSCGCWNRDQLRKIAKTKKYKSSAIFQDLTGQRFGRLVVLQRASDIGITPIMWQCLCDCGNTVDVRGDCLRTGKTQSCGCLAKEIWSKHMTELNARNETPNRNFVDLTGQRFGRLVVIGRAENSKGGHVRWLCQCDCGNQTITATAKLNSGRTHSCGCLGLENATKAKIKHGGTHSKLYECWAAMKRRCDNPHVAGYKYYGGKGVIVCDEWRDNFGAFQEWALSHGYSENLTIDRIDPNGNYEPDNCQWLTLSDNISKMHQQNRKPQ